MPFYDRLKNLITPKRVYALCKLVVKEDLEKEEVLDYLQPKVVNNNQDTVNDIYLFAKKGDLISEDSNGRVKSKLSQKEVESGDAFRRVIAQKVFSDSDLIFCRFTGWYLAQGEEVYNMSNEDLAKKFDDDVNKTNDPNKYNPTNINGWRTWAAFLGFGFVHNKVLVPNTWQRLADLLIEDQKLPREEGILFGDFMNWLNEKAPELDRGKIYEHNKGEITRGKKQLSLGLSNGLRMLHDEEIIELGYVGDVQDVWHLDKVDGHIKDDISEVIIKGA